MRVFTCTNHPQHYPVGCASVVVAETEEEARTLLDARLIERGLVPSTEHPYTLQELETGTPSAVMLCDGNY